MSSMEREYKFGLVDANTEVNLSMESSMDTACTAGRMEINTTENGRMVICRVLEFSTKHLDRSTLDTFTRTKEMARVS